jgi:phosphohistidine swiveling domain-containing protein
MANILPLNTKEASLEIAGGKGRSLASMSRAGFDVPDGFYVTTAAYRSFVKASDLHTRIVNLARPELRDNSVSFDSASEAIVGLIKGPQMSPELADEIRQAYSALAAAGGQDNPAVAVRSSANAEDLPDMSFAGQQDTFLNIRGEKALLEAVRDCWASLWTPRAISYRHQMGIGQDTVAMAVVVQLMVPSDVSGILFTANPVTGERSEMIVNASFGLGEAVVGGQVTPDTFVLDRDSLKPKQITIGTKEQQIVSDGEHGVRLEAIAEDARTASSMSESDLERLASVALRIEKHYHAVPQDIEWAMTGGKLWLLQSRPITNLPPQPIANVWKPTPPARFLVRRQIVENMPDPVCPLFEELYVIEGLMLEQPGGSAESDEWKEMDMMEGPLYTTVNGIAYQRMDWKPSKFVIPGINEHSGRPVDEQLEEQLQGVKEASETPEQMKMASHDMALFLDSLSSQERSAFDDLAMHQDRETLPQALTLPDSDNVRCYAHHRTGPSDQLMKDWRERALPELYATTSKWRKVDPARASDDQLIDGIRDLAHAEGRYWSGRNGGRMFGVIKCSDEQLNHFLQKVAPGQGLNSGVFLSGFVSKLMQANEQLCRISRLIQANDSLRELTLVTPGIRLMGALQGHPDARPVLAGINAYLETYGHQGYSLDFVEPPPIEEPSPVFATLKSMVADPDYDPGKHDREAARKRAAAFAKAEEVLDGLTYWQFRYRLWYASRYYPYREELLFPLGSAWPVLRPLAAEFGRRMVREGTFRLADDTFYLKMAELRACAAARGSNQALPEYGQLAAGRRELREARKRLRAPSAIPAEIIGHPSLGEVEAVNDPSSDTLNGIAVSPGRITAPASLINSPAEFDKMKPGSILVCPMTTPAWTQLFAHAAGLVTDIGGILGHGSIVAREFGIPAVVGTSIGTDRIRHGQMITVDGDAGTVSILSEDNADAS